MRINPGVLARCALAVSSMALATAIVACATKPADVSKDQYYFDQACLWANGAVTTAGPLLPILNLGTDAHLAAETLIASIKTTCSQPLDVANSKEVTQRIWDAAGQVIAIIVKANG